MMLSMVERHVGDSAAACPSPGLAQRLPPEVAAGLGAISRVARALNQPGSLEELAAHALAEMRRALGLAATVLYLPAGGGRPVLRRFLHDSPELASRAELVFDEEAWRLAVASGHPLVFHEAASWLVDNPFEPEARYWLALPMVANDDLVGVVIAARAEPVHLDPTTLTVLTLLGDQLSAGIATARLRQDLQRAELDRERMRLAAEVHDGLAQDLALAMRELAMLDLDLDSEQARASRERLREAVATAHRIVRARLVDLSSSAPLGGLRTALEDVSDRFARRGLPVEVEAPGEPLPADPAATAVVMRILNEALTNAEKHARASRVIVQVACDGDALELRVEDDGAGFDPESRAGPGEGHLGLTVMRQRAEDAGGSLELHSTPGAGTVVTLRIPLALRPVQPLRWANG
jgi:signal transduction histidine kinase